MLVLAPELIRRDLIVPPKNSPEHKVIQNMIFDRGVTWPWLTDDPRLARGGIIGNAQDASPELGSAIIDSVVREAGPVFQRLLENQKLMTRGGSR
jgi:creatinine amidohydrolase/Fe(II)-dependent formamide hydrolase-like protein